MPNTNRKRPQPTSSATLAVPGIDALLAKYARHLPPGGTVTVRLVRGPTSRSADPIAASRARKIAAARAAGQRQGGDGGVGSGAESDQADGSGRGAARPSDFPRVARFTDTVTPPDFQGGLANGRFYEEEVPKAKVRLRSGEGGLWSDGFKKPFEFKATSEGSTVSWDNA